MIFSTYEEHQKVLQQVQNREEFDDLKPGQMDAIRGMYWCLDTIENVIVNYDTVDSDSVIARMVKEVSVDALDEAILHIEIDIMETLVAFRDANAVEDGDE